MSNNKWAWDISFQSPKSGTDIPDPVNGVPLSELRKVIEKRFGDSDIQDWSLADLQSLAGVIKKEKAYRKQESFRPKIVNTMQRDALIAAPHLKKRTSTVLQVGDKPVRAWLVREDSNAESATERRVAMDTYESSIETRSTGLAVTTRGTILYYEAIHTAIGSGAGSNTITYLDIANDHQIAPFDLLPQELSADTPPEIVMQWRSKLALLAGL